MGLRECSTEPICADVGVALRGLQGGVAEDLLDAAQIRTAVEKMRGGGMAQIVGGNIGHPRAAGRTVHHVAQRARVEAPTLRPQKESPSRFFHKSGTRRQVFLHGPHGRHPVRDHAFLISFSDDAHRQIGANLVNIQGTDFAHAQTRRVHELKGRPVPVGESFSALNRVAFRVIEQLLGLVLVENMRELVGDPR